MKAFTQRNNNKLTLLETQNSAARGQFQASSTISATTTAPTTQAPLIQQHSVLNTSGDERVVHSFANTVIEEVVLPEWFGLLEREDEDSFKLILCATATFAKVRPDSLVTGLDAIPNCAWYIYRVRGLNTDFSIRDFIKHMKKGNESKFLRAMIDHENGDICCLILKHSSQKNSQGGAGRSRSSMLSLFQSPKRNPDTIKEMNDESAEKQTEEEEEEGDDEEQNHQRRSEEIDSVIGDSLIKKEKVSGMGSVKNYYRGMEDDIMKVIHKIQSDNIYFAVGIEAEIKIATSETVDLHLSNFFRNIDLSAIDLCRISFRDSIHDILFNAMLKTIIVSFKTKKRERKTGKKRSRNNEFTDSEGESSGSSSGQHDSLTNGPEHERINKELQIERLAKKMRTDVERSASESAANSRAGTPAISMDNSGQFFTSSASNTRYYPVVQRSVSSTPIPVIYEQQLSQDHQIGLLSGGNEEGYTLASSSSTPTPQQFISRPSSSLGILTDRQTVRQNVTISTPTARSASVQQHQIVAPRPTSVPLSGFAAPQSLNRKK